MFGLKFVFMLLVKLLVFFFIDRVGRRYFIFGQQIFYKVIDVAAQNYIGTAAGHISSNGNLRQSPRLRHNHRFLLVIFGVKDIMGYAFLIQQEGKFFRIMNRRGTDQHRLFFLVILFDFVYYRVKFTFFCFINPVGIIEPGQAFISRHDHNV